MTILAAFAPLNGADLRNVVGYAGTGTISNVADADFIGGRAINETANSWFVPFADTTFAVNDEFNIVGEFSLEAWAPGANQRLLYIAGSRGPTPTGSLLGMGATDADSLTLRFFTNGVDLRESSGLYSMTIGTPVRFRIRIKRDGTSSQDTQLYIWESGAWASKGTLTGTDSYSSTTISQLNIGASGYGKGGSGQVRWGFLLVGYNEVPDPTTLWEAQLPNGEDGVEDDWTPSTGTDNSAVIDDAIGSESTADYTESGTSAAEMKESFTAADMTFGSSDTVVGVNFILGVTTPSGSPAANVYTVTPQLSGTDDAQQAYYGDTNYGTGASAQACYVHRLYVTKPGGGAWTLSDINSATWQLERENAGGTPNWRVHSMAVQAFYIAAAAATRRIWIM